ncbi:hypothetical protein QLX08_000437 [Tetragonisca angustula]|uniref:Uncharacterized protein n=1 Tax=Tetragonisca angustula TaxID=166442 RepID=A0AAW1AM62_9HYME
MIIAAEGGERMRSQTKLRQQIRVLAAAERRRLAREQFHATLVLLLRVRDGSLVASPRDRDKLRVTPFKFQVSRTCRLSRREKRSSRSQNVAFFSQLLALKISSNFLATLSASRGGEEGQSAPSVSQRVKRGRKRRVGRLQRVGPHR